LGEGESREAHHPFAALACEPRVMTHGSHTRRIGVLGPVLAAGLLGAPAAQAHPHVWVSARTEIVLDAKRSLVGLRHVWTFDQAYSAYQTLNLDSKQKGVPDADKLAALAKTNVESIAEYGYFTQAKLNGKDVAFAAPTDYALAYRDGRLVLTFLLKPQTPSPARVMALTVDDPEFFVAFSLAEGADAVRITGAEGCALNVTRARAASEGEQLVPDEEAADGKAAAVGEDYTSRILVACP
jgi:ABC-type uncharacterized transport system substrate-binding protein